MSRPSTPAPSVRVDRDRPGWLPWLLGLLLLALLAAVLFFALADDEEDDLAVEDSASQPLDEPTDADIDADADVDADIEADADADAEAAPEVSADAGAGTDTSAATAPLVLAVPFPSLEGEEGRAVSASSVEVVDVPADEAFTIGVPDDELLVHLTPQARAGTGESATNVEPGSTVSSLEGTLEPITDEFLSTLDLSGDEADAVRERGLYVAATAFELAAS